MLVIKGDGWSAGNLAFSPDGSLLAVTSHGVSLRVFETATGKQLWSIPPVLHDYRDGAACFSPDGRFVVRQWLPGEVFEAASGRRVAGLPPHEAPGGPDWPFLPLGPGVPVRLLSPDGRWATGGASLHITDRTTGTERDLYPRYGRDEKGRPNVPLWALTPMAFSPDGSLLAAGDHSRLRLLRVESLEIEATLKLVRKHFQAAAFTPDGRHLITVSNEATARVWDTDTWSERAAYAWKAGPLKCVAVTADGTRAACGGSRGKVVVWDLDL
jgi:WD40 repeat protein